MTQLEFLDDPVKFLAVANPLLEAEPVQGTVVASVSARLARDGVPDLPVPVWWLVVRDETGAVVGAGMRTSPEAPHAPYLLPMPDDAARELARTLHQRGEEITRFNGALPATEVAASVTASLSGRTTRIAERMRLYELRTLVPPTPAPAGRLRIAVAADLDVVFDSFDAFAVDAAEQAGHLDPHPAPIETRESTLRRIEAGEVWLWEVDGVPVNVTAFNPPQFGVARVGPVHTPKQHRGHGYAAAAVAEVSRALLEDGNRVCLFAEVDNPTSCAIYERLGYERVVEMANLVIEPGVRKDGKGDPTRT